MKKRHFLIGKKQMEKVYTSQERVSCSGGDYEGHPRVYLDVAKKGTVTCPYCSKTYILDL